MKHIPRFYVEANFAKDDDVILSVDQMHHANRVLRFTTGDVVRIFNSWDGEWDCTITSLKQRTVRCISQLRGRINGKEERGAIIACALINPKRFDFFLEKATELGAREIIPIMSTYVQHCDFNLRKALRKVTQAGEQSNRLSIPSLRNVMNLEDLLQNYSPSYKILVGDEGFSSPNLGSVLEEKCVFLVGPEGGFSNEEHNLFEKFSGIKKFSSGKNILRSETAAAAFLAIWNDKFM
ncbi:MAG: 16S rRNA (uracil(1498)-N(3))-methyltransferase [Holosporaceae bacterium]|jgi:16S rRNA (uracil1498-N3)-methyltransferase|nr:16S rRNA (uracil(1498)-N(3))-methyltransferase [Holosporaceae bacterium]